MVLAASATALAALLLAAPPAADGGPAPASPPDSAHLAVASRQCGAGSLVRIRTGETTLLVRDPRFSPDGVTGFWDAPAESRNSVTSFAPERRTVVWDHIASVEKGGNWSPLGAKLGFTLGMALGFVAAASVERDWGADPTDLVEYGVSSARGSPPSTVARAFCLVATPVVGTAIGALAGALVPRWRRVAP